MIAEVHSEFETCELAISELIQKSPIDNPFVSLAWCKLWWKHYGGKGKSLYIVLFKEDGKNIGAALFFRIKRPLLGVCEYHFVGRNLSNYLDIICLPGFEESICRTLFDHFRNMTSSSIVFLTDINDRFSRCFRPLQAALTGERCRGSIHFLYPCPLTSFSGTWEDYFKRQRDKKSRHNLRRSEKQFSKFGTVRFREVIDQTERLDIFPRLERIHSQRFAHTINPLLNGTNRTFFAAVLSELPPSVLSLTILEVDDVPVSFLIGFPMGTVFIDYAPAFDPALEKWSVGSIHLIQLMQLKIREGYGYFDFSKGEARYKRWWSTDETKNFLFQLRFNSSVRAAIYNFYLDMKFNALLWLRTSGYAPQIKRYLASALLGIRRVFSAPKICAQKISKDSVDLSQVQMMVPWSFKLIDALPVAVRKVILDCAVQYIDGGLSLYVSDEKLVILMPHGRDYVYRISYR